VNASIPIADVARVAVGAAAHMQAGETAASLRVVSRPIVVDPGTAAVPVRLRFAAATPLPVGTPVDVEIDAEQHRGVVLVPSAAVMREGDETAVFVAAGDKAQRRAVTTGVSDAQRTEIKSGVQSGDMVIIDGQTGLPDGAAITVTPPAEK
jgi:hypothetical protein